jgi:hypothetical protein
MVTEAEREAFRKREQSQQTKIVLGVIGAGVVLIGILVFTMKEDRGFKTTEEPVVEERQPERRPLKEVTLAPRPLRLYHEYVKAIAANDRRTVENLSVLEPSVVDQIMDADRVEMIARAYPQRMYREEEGDVKIEGQKARIVKTFQNKVGLDAEGIALTMEQQGANTENWKVTKFENRYYAASNKTPESTFVAIGENRALAAAPIKHESSFRVAPEADPAPQDWLPETTEEQKKTIGDLMTQLMDESHPARTTAASQELINIGKPAIPALLTQLAKYDVRMEDGNRQANVIDRTLAAMTQLEMGYDAVGLAGAAGALPPALARVRAVRRWFGWWGESGKTKPLKKKLDEDIK